MSRCQWGDVAWSDQGMLLGPSIARCVLKRPPCTLLVLCAASTSLMPRTVATEQALPLARYGESPRWSSWARMKTT